MVGGSGVRGDHAYVLDPEHGVVELVGRSVTHSGGESGIRGKGPFCEEWLDNWFEHDFFERE